MLAMLQSSTWSDDKTRETFIKQLIDKPHGRLMRIVKQSYTHKFVFDGLRGAKDENDVQSKGD